MIVLVTGGLGFIGSEIVKQWYLLGAEVRIIDDGSYAKCKKILDDSGYKYKLFLGSITNRNLVREAMEGVDYVFHAAALISVADSFRIPERYDYINVQGTIILLQEAQNAGIKHFVFSSSCAVYGDGLPVQKTETLLPAPLSPYAFTKLHAEHYCSLFANKLKISILRYFNVFGIYQDASRPYAGCIASFFNKCQNCEDLVIYGSGEQTRSFVHVEDVARANIFCAMNNLEGIYNLGYPNEISINTLAESIVCSYGDVNIVYQPARAGDVSRISCNSEKLLDKGFSFKYSFERALNTMVAAYKEKHTLL